MGLGTLNVVLCLCVGLFIGTAWAFLVDGILYANAIPDAPPFEWLYSLPAIGITVSMLLLNMVQPHDMRGGGGSMGFGDEDSIRGAICVRFWVFFMVTVSFACIGGAIWIATAIYGPAHTKWTWPGGAVVIQAVLSMLAGIVFFMRFRPRSM